MRVLIVLFTIIGLALAASPQVAKWSDSRTNQQRIVGGSPTTVQNYPYMTSMLYTFWSIWTYQACGGVLLTSVTVLSAGNCYFGDVASDWSVIVGSNFPESGGSRHTVSAIRMHPEYNDWTMDFDMAILRLTSAVNFGDSVGTALVAGADYRLPAGTSVTVLGYGNVAEGGPNAEVLQEALITTVDHTICAQRYAQLKQTPGFGLYPDVTSNMLCAGLLGVGGRDACLHDAGGPLIHNGNVVLGLVSWGHLCGSPDYPGVYTDVAENVDWIIANGSA